MCDRFGFAAVFLLVHFVVVDDVVFVHEEAVAQWRGRWVGSGLCPLLFFYF